MNKLVFVAGALELMIMSICTHTDAIIYMITVIVVIIFLPSRTW
jgi:hypothetical protein